MAPGLHLVGSLSMLGFFVGPPASDAPGPDGSALPRDLPADPVELEPVAAREPPPPDDAVGADPVLPVASESAPITAPAPAPPPLPRTTPNGRPCDDPRQGKVARVLQTIEGWHPCEESRIDLGKEGRVRFYPGVQLRNAIAYVSPFDLDSEGARYRDNAHVNGRFRVSPRFEAGGAKIVASMDFASGRWAPHGSFDSNVDRILSVGQPPYLPTPDGGAYPPVTYNLRVFDLREAYFEYLFPSVGVLRIGQQAFTWGQGLIANDGNHVDRFGDLRFGDDGRGALYERVIFATKPFANLKGNAKDLVVAVGGDVVYRDENADITRGDLAGQAIFVLRYQPSSHPGNWIGGYAAYRKQKSADDGDAFSNDNLLQVGVFDIAGQGVMPLRKRLSLVGAFEVANISGRTRFFSETGRDEVLYQTGAALRGYIGVPERWLVGFDGGVASGDANPNDSTITSFRARPGYSAGLLMFPYLQGWQSARAEQLARDDSLAAVDPQGVQYIPTGGGVTNAVHIQPKARWGFAKKFEVWGGPLFAVAPTPVYDPFASNINGGVATNSIGGPGSKRFLGTELDLGVRARYSRKGVWIQGGVQGGLLFPGAAFADANGDKDAVVGGIFVRTEIRY